MKEQFKSKIMLTNLLLLAGSLCIAACKPNKIKTSSNQISTGKNVSTKQSNAFPAPDLTLTGENGKKVTLSSLKGKVVFINFWATRCPPCREEMPTIQKLKATFKDNDNIVFLMVDVDGVLDKSLKYMQKHQYDLPVYVADGPIPPEFIQDAIPTTVVIDKNGSLYARAEGARDYSHPEIIKVIKGLTEM